MSIEGNINVSALFHETTGGGLASQLRASSASYALPITDGTGANQAQTAWSSSASASGTFANDLTIQNLPDDRGEVYLTSVKVIYIRNKSSTYSLLVTFNNWTSLDSALLPINLNIRPGGVFVYTNPTASGWTTDGSSTMSLIAEGEGQTVDYDVLLVGEGTVS